MKTPPPLRFSVDLRTKEVIDLHTGQRIPCATTDEMAKVRRDLELAHQPVYVRKPRVKEQW